MRIVLVVAPVLLGAWIYWNGRITLTRYERLFTNQKNAVPSGVANWLPDYLWCVSLLACISLIWNGWENIPPVWRWVLWLLVGVSELLQHEHWIPGTGDWWDFVCYQGAFLTIIILSKTKML